MQLTLRRLDANASRTKGVLLIDGDVLCHTVELPLGDGGPGCAIPAGTYEVAITLSQRFGRMLPLVLEVPGRSGIRIHPGNTKADTDGCILPGFLETPDGVGESAMACSAVQAKIADRLAYGDTVTLTVINPPVNV